MWLFTTIYVRSTSQTGRLHPQADPESTCLHHHLRLRNGFFRRAQGEKTIQNLQTDWTIAPWFFGDRLPPIRRPMQSPCNQKRLLRVWGCGLPLGSQLVTAATCSWSQNKTIVDFSFSWLHRGCYFYSDVTEPLLDSISYCQMWFIRVSLLAIHFLSRKDVANCALTFGCISLPISVVELLCLACRSFFVCSL